MSNQEATYWAVIPAAGCGSRMGEDRPKQYLSLGSQTIIEHTLKQFIALPEIKGIVVALNPSDRYWAHLKIPCGKPMITVIGGEERCHSVLSALEYLNQRVQPHTWVLVHDAARPCLTLSDLTKLIVNLADDDVGGILGLPVRDTLKRSGANQRIENTVDRSSLWHALTPQMFRIDVLTRALSFSIREGYFVTDEASAVEHIGLSPKLIEGRGDNIKITRPEDLALAKYYLLERRVSEI